jgi:hypothetical protein
MSMPSSQSENASPPDLRIVATSHLVPHELHDDQRAGPLIERLKQDGILKNPPIVTPMTNDPSRYVILDGANRVLAFQVLNIPYMLVQAVPYEQPYVNLQTWHHAIVGMKSDDLVSRFASLPDLAVTESDILHARAALERRDALAYYLLADGQAFTLIGGYDLRKRTHLLRSIVDTYMTSGRLHRVSTDQRDELLSMFPNMTAAVVFPHYQPVEILDLAQSGLRVPPGITRHIINGRALRLNYPIDRLMASESLERKNADLTAWIQAKFEQRGVRFYAEATYLFDE